MSDTGFFLLPRRWSEIPAIERRAGPFCARSAWVWLIERAAYADRTIAIGCRSIALKRGQLVDSYRYLAEAWGWSLGAVQRFLADLVADTEIVCNVDNFRLVITICNYDQMQQAARQPEASPEAPRDLPLIRARYADDTKDKQGKQRKQNKVVPPIPPLDCGKLLEEGSPRERGEGVGADLNGSTSQERPSLSPARPPRSPRARAAEAEPVACEAKPVDGEAEPVDCEVFRNASPRCEGQARSAKKPVVAPGVKPFDGRGGVKVLLDDTDESWLRYHEKRVVEITAEPIQRPHIETKLERLDSLVRSQSPRAWQVLTGEAPPRGPLSEDEVQAVSRKLDEHDMEGPVLRASGPPGLHDAHPQGRP